MSCLHVDTLEGTEALQRALLVGEIADVELQSLAAVTPAGVRHGDVKDERGSLGAFGEVRRQKILFNTIP